MKVTYLGDELYHHGVKGQRWGIRRFQQMNGRYTPQGMNRYNINQHPQQQQQMSSGQSQKKKFQVSDRTRYLIKSGAELAVLSLAAYGGYKRYQMGRVMQSGQDAVTNLISNVAEASVSAVTGD